MIKNILFELEWFVPTTIVIMWLVSYIPEGWPDSKKKKDTR